MPNITILNAREHRALRIRTHGLADAGERQRFVQVVATEFPLLVTHYPILFTKNSETGGFVCGAMLGFDPGEDLFQGSHAQYRPLNLQRGPFYTAGADLAIDLDSPCVSDSEGEPLFAQDGTPGPYLQSIFALFRELQRGTEITRQFIDRMKQLKLIVPIDVDLSFDDGETRQLRDLYTLDQEVLRSLPDADVVELFRRGYLQLAYLMIASVKQIAVLARMRNDQLLQPASPVASFA